MKPDFRLYKEETTEYWNEDIVKQAGRLYDLYIFDANNGFNACELTPSYEMNYVGPTWTTSPEDEYESAVLFENVLLGTSDTETSYVHTKDVDLEECERLGLSDVDWQRAIEDAQGDTVEAQRALLGKYIESCRCNGYIY